MFIGRSAGEVRQAAKSSEYYHRDWPAYFAGDMSSLKRVNAQLHDYEKAPNKHTGSEVKLVDDRGWPNLNDEYEEFTLKFFGLQTFSSGTATSDGAQLAIDDLDSPPTGVALPDRATRIVSIFNLHRVNRVLRGDRMHWLDAFQGFEPDLGFELGAMLTTFLRHMD